jgi:hypothetical protein
MTAEALQVHQIVRSKHRDLKVISAVNVHDAGKLICSGVEPVPSARFAISAHRGALNVLPMTARHPVSCPSMCGEDQIRGSMRCGISGPLWSAQGH